MRFGLRGFLCGATVLLSSPLCRPASIDDVVRAEASKAIRWVAFWEGAEALGSGYSPGRNINVRVMRTQDRWYAVLGSIRMVLEATTEGADSRVQAMRIVRTPGASNAEAAEWYFRMEGQMGTGCIDGNRAAPSSNAGPTIPTGRPCPSTRVGTLSDDTLSFTLPALAPPEAIQKKTVPADKDVLAAAVRRYVDSRVQICGSLRAKVPFYSDTDPLVYVLLPKGGDCPRGVATFSRAALESGWEFGKFIADFPKEQLSGVVARIESNTAMIIP